MIVTGDFNARYSESDILANFAAANGLTDAWVELEYGGLTPTDAPGCSTGNKCELLDKVFYRSGSGVTLQAIDYANEELDFVNGQGQPLSDHTPAAVRFTYKADNLTAP